MVEKRDHIGGNIYTEEVEGINVHKYGAHIFHTSDKRIWQYMQQFAEFNRYTNSPVANYKGEIYNLPFNMNTFNKLWGVVTPNEAKDKIQKQVEAYRASNPKNLEEQALNLVGKDIYEKLIKGYTENSGDIERQSFQWRLLREFRFDILMTIIISMISIKGFLLEAIPQLLKKCWRKQM